jgi:hypothetical protein
LLHILQTFALPSNGLRAADGHQTANLTKQLHILIDKKLYDKDDR